MHNTITPPASLKETISAAADFLRGLALTLPETRPQTDRWLATLHQLQETTQRTQVPVTVIGTVKSGKSTLINALVGRPLLPMAAGITTTFLTAVRGADKLGARITLQPLEQLDFIFQQAAGLLFPDTCGENPPRLSDTEDRNDVARQLRDYTATAMTSLTSRGMFHEPYRLLQNLLQGYEAVAEYYAAGTPERTFDSTDFNLFLPCIASEPVSAYLARAEVFCPLPDLPELLTLQDCQGLDTPSPTQQALVIRQLALSPTLIFVVSSRMGLRQADYQLLEHIRELGLAERLQFVLNLDLLEHPTVASLEGIIARCRKELEEIGCRQPLYAFSALYHLLERQTAAGSAPDEHDPRKMALWGTKADLLAYSHGDWERFTAELRRIGTADAARTLIDHTADRLRHIIADARRTLDRFDGTHTARQTELETSAATARREAARIEAAAARLPEALTGILAQLEKRYAAAVDSWFGRTDGTGISARLTSVIEAHSLPDDLPGVNRKNPLASLDAAWRHFHLTTAAALREQAAAALTTQWQVWEREINAVVTAECLPLLTSIVTPGSETANVAAPPLPGPPGWGEQLPEFSFTTHLSERFGTVFNLAFGARLLGARLRNPTGRQPWRKILTDHIRREALQRLRNRLLDLQEQVKFAFLRPYLHAWQEQIEDLARSLTNAKLEIYRHEQEELTAKRDSNVHWSVIARQLRRDADTLMDRIQILAAANG
jgi:hypothetical protein